MQHSDVKTWRLGTGNDEMSQRKLSWVQPNAHSVTPLNLNSVLGQHKRSFWQSACS